MKNKFIKLSFTIFAFLLMLSCTDNENFTGDSTLKVTTPSLTVQLDFADSQTLIEQEISYDFTVTIDQRQIVDVLVYLEQTAGTATLGDDFTMPGTVTIKKGTLSASGSISILEDELLEDTETATIQIATSAERNVSSVSGQTVSFNIANLTAGDLEIGLTWSSSTTVTDNEGVAILAEDLADLELLVSNTTIPTSQTFLSVDEEEGFESFTFSENFPDGEYFLVAQFFSAADFGSVYANLDLTLNFNQVGKVNNETVTVKSALNTANAGCQKAIIAKLIKSGTDYTFEAVGVNNNAGIPSDGTFVGAYTVETTTAGAFGAQFDGTVTLVDEGNGVRSFEGDWNGFGYVETYKFEFNPSCGTVTFQDDQSTGLGCGGPGISHGASPNANTISDPSDDSSFSVNYLENTTLGCGAPASEVTIKFTKI